MLDVVPDIFLAVYLAVVEDGGVHKFPQLVGVQVFLVNFLKFSRWTDADGVVNLGHSLDEVLNFGID